MTLSVVSEATERGAVQRSVRYDTELDVLVMKPNRSAGPGVPGAVQIRIVTEDKEIGRQFRRTIWLDPDTAKLVSTAIFQAAAEAERGRA